MNKFKRVNIMKERNYNIDVLKACAIISVILLHTLPWKERFLIGAPFHIWQAVPVFMLLIGYNFSNSSILKGYTSLKDVYQWSLVRRRVLNIFIPFFIIALVRLVLQFILNDQVNWQSFITGIFMGDFEHGGYFIPVMIQTLIIVPILFVILRKNIKRNTILLLIFTYILDWGVILYNIRGDLYRILVIRYLFVIVLGLWLGMKKDKIDYRKLLLLALGSFIYITSIYYFELNTTLETYWQAQHGPAYFWTLLIVIIFLKFFTINSENLLMNCLSRIGQASYHIYLVQMIYYWLINQYVYKMSLGAHMILNILVCSLLGILFNKINNHVYFIKK